MWFVIVNPFPGGKAKVNLKGADWKVGSVFDMELYGPFTEGRAMKISENFTKQGCECLVTTADCMDCEEEL